MVNVDRISRLLYGRPSLVDRILFYLFLRNLPKVRRSNWWHYGANNDWYEVMRRLLEVFSREEVIWIAQNVQNQRLVPISSLMPLTARQVNEIWQEVQKEKQETGFFSQLAHLVVTPFATIASYWRNEKYMPIVVLLFLVIVLLQAGVFPMLAGGVRGLVGGSIGAIQGAQSFIAPQKEPPWSNRGGLSAALSVKSKKEQQKTQAVQAAAQPTIKAPLTPVPSATPVPATPTPSMNEGQVLKAGQEIYAAARGGAKQDGTCWVNAGPNECAQGYFQVFIVGVQDQAREKPLISVEDITSRLQERLGYAQERLGLIEQARQEVALNEVAAWNEKYVQQADITVRLMEECLAVWNAYSTNNSIEALAKTKAAEDLFKKLDAAYCQDLMVEAGVDCKAEKPLTSASQGGSS